MMDVGELRKQYDFVLKRFKVSLHRCEWLNLKMLAAEDLKNQRKLSLELIHQEEDAAGKFAQLSELDGQLKKLNESTVLRDFEERAREKYPLC